MTRNAYEVGKAMAALPQPPLSPDDAYTLGMAFIAETTGLELTPDLLSDDLLMIMRRRCDVFGVPVTHHTLATLRALVVDRPAVGVMWCAALHAIARDTGKTVDLMTLTDKHFPDGFPKPDDLREIWLSQKLPNGDNMLDTAEGWR